MTHPEIAKLKVVTPEELDEMVEEVLFVEAWAAAVRVLLTELLEQGHEFKNAALEPKRPTRKWEVEEILLVPRLREVFALLKKDSSDDSVQPRKVLSPAEAEKVVGKVKFKEHLADLAEAKSSGFNLKLNVQRT